MKFERKKSIDYTYYTTRAEKYWRKICADINKIGNEYELSFCKLERGDIKDVKVIDWMFTDLERCKTYAELFILWFLYA